MIDNNRMPDELNNYVGSESRDFVVKAKRADFPGKYIFLIFFSIVWTAMPLSMLVAWLTPFFTPAPGKASFSLTSDLPVLISTLAFPGIFVVVGFAIFGFSLYSLLRSGGYFVGTPTRLVVYDQGELRSISWEQFSGDITTIGNNTNGSLTLMLKSIKTTSSSRKSGPTIEQDSINIIGIPNVYSIEQACRNRIIKKDS